MPWRYPTGRAYLAQGGGWFRFAVVSGEVFPRAALVEPAGACGRAMRRLGSSKNELTGQKRICMAFLCPIPADKKRVHSPCLFQRFFAVDDYIRGVTLASKNMEEMGVKGGKPVVPR